MTRPRLSVTGSSPPQPWTAQSSQSGRPALASLARFLSVRLYRVLLVYEILYPAWPSPQVPLPAHNLFLSLSAFLCLDRSSSSAPFLPPHISGTARRRVLRSAEFGPIFLCLSTRNRWESLVLVLVLATVGTTNSSSQPPRSVSALHPK